MAQIIFGERYDPGERELYEDRVKAALVRTASGLEIVIGVVADGVGGQNKGEVAAQEAINALFECIQTSHQTRIQDILVEAANTANRAVRNLNRDGTSSTLAVAAIYNNTLYIANVGDSRIYLCRNGKLTQLTIDLTDFLFPPMIAGAAPRERARLRREAGSRVRTSGLPLLAFMTGAAAGALGTKYYGFLSIAVPTLVVATLSAVALVRSRRSS